MKILFYTMALAFLLVYSATAGMVQALTDTYVASEPTFNDAEYMTVTFYYSSSGDHRAVISYYTVDSNGNRIGDLQHRQVYDRPDNPVTDPTECIAAEDPYACCTGAYPGDPNDGCDEEVTDFSAFTSGYLTTINTRSKIAVEQKIAAEFDEYVP